VQTGWEEIWPSGWNKKIKLKQVNRNEPKKIKNLIEKMGN